MKMVVDTLMDKLPAWVARRDPDAGVAILCHCTLARNLSDFPFPSRCTDDEKHAIENRVLGVLDRLNLLSAGRYYSLQELSSTEMRFLAERRLITYELLCAKGPRGVYIAEDQTLSIMVNAVDHLCVRVLESGLQLQEAWAHLNLMDDTLHGMLDFAFHERLGFLTASLNCVGTGLKAGVLLHLPALAMNNAIQHAIDSAAAQHLVLSGVRIGGGSDAGKTANDSFDNPLGHDTDEAMYSDMDGALRTAVTQTSGDLCLLVNRSTLGLSEAEIVFKTRHAASEIMAEEKAARDTLMQEGAKSLEDKAGRARGVAGNAHLMGFTEGIDLLSALRLGVDLGVTPELNLGQVDELLLASQGAHIEIHRGKKCDALALSMARADLFRSKVTGN